MNDRIIKALLFICFPVCVCVSGLEIEGIFRRSANVTLVKEIQHRYNSGQITTIETYIKIGNYIE